MENTLVQSLDLMWKGMVSIFVVIGAIFVVTFVITHWRNRKMKEASKADSDGSAVQ